jgi:hypothetical protein
MERKKIHIGKNLLILGLDPDPHSSQSLHPDPHIMNADPKHCCKDYRYHFKDKKTNAIPNECLAAEFCTRFHEIMPEVPLLKNVKSTRGQHYLIIVVLII